MLRVLSCLVINHDLRLVILAGLVCFISSFAAVSFLNRAMRATGGAKALWIASGGVCGGFGIWATHFIAMLAYRPGFDLGFELNLTVLSLAAAILMVSVGLGAAAMVRDGQVAILGGAIAGLGIALMHFLGMRAVMIPADITWQTDLVVASIVLGMLLDGAAFYVVSRRERMRETLLGAGLLTLGIVCLHFTAMGAVVVHPDPTRATMELGISSSMLALVIAAAALLILVFCLGVAIVGRRAQDRADEKDLNFRLLVEGMTDYALYLLDETGHITNWNAGAERTKGYRPEEAIGRHFGMFYTEADRQAGLPQRALQTALAEGKFESEGIRVRKDGSTFWAHVVIDPIRRPDGSLLGFAKITRDISRKKADADAVAEARRNLDVALGNMSQGLCLFDADERLVLWNPRFEEVFGLPADAVERGLTMADLVMRVGAVLPGQPDTPEAALEAYERHRRVIRAGGGAMIETLPDGSILSIVHTVHSGGGFVSTFEDITERSRSEARIVHMARHDGLTGLPNRDHFNERLDDELEAAARLGLRVAVVGIDLNDFKEINDQRGHATGDEVLKIVAARLAGDLQEGEFVARFGGDEFVALKRFSHDEDLHGFLARLEVSLCTRIEIDGFEIVSGASAGVAVYPEDAVGRDQLVNNADLAMYRAKATIGRFVCFYEARMDEAARHRRALARDLWKAIELGQFGLFYQIQKSVGTGETTGYEVLLRWRHPERGMVSPAEFIPIAEECGAIVPLGEWVLREACRQAASWAQPWRIAVNLSPVQLGHADLVAVVHGILVETGLQPARLELEITESAIIGDKVRALHILRQIKALGVTIAIDDFGTGYSSLDTLRSFPFDKIKLDRSFMTEIETNRQSKAIIRAILALGRSLEVPVLAEGVETRSQLDLLRHEGCDEAQGYLLGRPAPLECSGPAAEPADLPIVAIAV
ncbi:bifunctional diguanylate cyclase/phosphodiesterase [Methylobrevis pamukkalensis]|uniref:Cyclic di-GMP phosphodiesterase Gmr n=1 Tax=Methylobrevis pamukkalensis TaxID=1439726 RepID=A0A1E3H799_9HYPH|nr:EAL domain-containing protein [Methylobrevis pamukkalensis]ODN72208.1 Cyclic di-GMP phosphodiesterase Gmr [Methylobrevis pamukkalensis]